MKYFAKYLPVEGEIKDGDPIVYDGYEGISTRHDKRGREVLIKGGVHLQKVQLFLCSRDIQVGDKARSIVKPEEEFEVSHIQIGSGKDYFPAEMLVWNKLDNQVSLWRTLTNTFKVIGPISPQAVWVKEGDEFDEKELALSLGPYYNYPLGRADEGIWEDWLKSPMRAISIKCPTCKTFH